MRKSADYRKTARERLRGNYGMIIGAYIIYSLILNFFSFPLSISAGIGELMGFRLITTLLSFPITIVVNLASSLFAVGVDRMTYDAVLGEKPDITKLFYSFTHNPLTVIFSYLWIMLYLLPAAVILGAGIGSFLLLLFMIRGTAATAAGIALLSISIIVYIIWIIVIAMAVSMTYFLYFDNDDMTAHDLVRASIDMMRGNKLRLFKLHLSYLGYYILGLLSLGLAFLWINPNVTAATALFYRDLLENKNSTEDKNNPGGSTEEPHAYSDRSFSYHQDYWN